MPFMETGETADLVRNLSILFVEDDADVRESMTHFLSRRVNKVHSAQNGLAGLDSFRELHPDLVISDIRMGGMDGLTMCRRIRETEPEFPVIIISAHNEPDILLSSIDLGVTKFIVKPVDMDELMAAIQSVAQMLSKRRHVESLQRQADSVRTEADYDNACVKNYVSHLLEENHHDELLHIRQLNIPKLDVSGDFYSIARCGDDVYVMLADGAGHGLSAVLPALQLPKLFQQQAERGLSLLTIAAELNRSLYAQRIVEHFVAVTLVRINQGEGFVEVLNCSNPPVLIFGDDARLLHDARSKSVALGMVRDEEFSVEAERFNVKQNARIYLLTDGLIDTLRATRPDFDYNQLVGMLGGASSPEAFDELAKQISDAASQRKQDDVTLLEIRYDGNGAVQLHADMPPPAGLAAPYDEPVALRNATLLYVEDDDLTRDYTALYLNRRMGMVYVAKDGREGLELFRKHRPQMVLADDRMPEMNGLEMIREIRKLDKDVPIIVISGFGSAEDTEKMFEMGISRFHMKPMNPVKLTDAIQTCLREANELGRLRLSASSFQNSSLAVITADLERRIVAINPSFSRITGYSLSDVRGQSPAMLSSGSYDAAHYREMWDELAESGNWSGELQCQHKNGKTFSEWVTVNTVMQADGTAMGYHFVFSDMSAKKMNEEREYKLKSYDSLTNLPNRELFANRIRELLAGDAPLAGSLALAYFNIDRFIEINNTMGVNAGDDVLLTVARRLLAGVEKADMVGRLGGDEFAVLLRRDEGRNAFEQVVTELSRAVGQPIDLGENRIQLRLSTGISIYPSDGDNYEDLIKNASSAMNHAQLAGGNTYRFFDKSVSQIEERHVMLRQGISAGLQHGEFFMLYQPKYSFSQKKVIGAEALVRWKHPVYGLVSPAEFIPLAESSGAVIEMSEWIINTVCAQIAAWREQGVSLVPVSINISPMHFWRGNLVESLQNGLHRWGIETWALPIEVTESLVMNTSERTLEVLNRLKELGFRISIDDFGTGYSSLKYLKDLPISELKIDRSFVIEIPEKGEAENNARTAITRTIIRLATEFNLSVVAEGVETESQRDFLVENGCDVIQGYLFSPPISADEFGTMLQ